MKQVISEELRQGILKEAAAMRKANQTIKVTGKRFDIPAKGRNINIVYYETKREPAPLIIAFHGGGFLFGGNAMNDAMWSAVAEKLDMNVASVEYRKSPEYQYQEALDDAYDALVYLAGHADEIGFDGKHILVMGCSAGANIATALCIYSKRKRGPKIECQILMYPFLDCFTDPDSKGEGSLSGPIMYVFNELHCSPENAQLSIVSPVFAEREELTGLPKAIFCMADNDNLKHEGYRYAKMLQNAGVKVFITKAPGMPHGFFEYGYDEVSDAETAFLDKETRAMIKDGSITEASEESLLFIKRSLFDA